MPLQQTSGNDTTDAYGGGAAVVPAYIEEVFSTYLYTGTGAAQTITNNIDLSTKGGMVWIKSRSSATNNNLFDTAQGATKSLHSNNTYAVTTDSNSLTAFNTTGFTIGTGGTYENEVNISSSTYVSWTFRKQPKFFDVVTWTGNGVGSQTISHNLGSVPECILAKRATSAGGAWYSYHSGIPTANNKTIVLNTDGAALNLGVATWNPTSTTFNAASNLGYNNSGQTYIAYIFASNAGGFGAAGTDNVITCGSYTGNGSATGPVVTLGYEPQWIMIKNSSSTGNWQILDNMRGIPVGSADATLQANLSDAESSVEYASPTATGFQITSTNTEVNTNSDTYIYIAIRRGPMKTPTDATKVFSPTTATSEPTSTPLLTGGGFPSDMVLHRPRYTLTSYGFYNTGRLTGGGLSVLSTYNTNAASSYGTTYWNFDNSTAAYIPANGYFNNNGEGNIGYALYSFRRAPGFFDEVCFTTPGSISSPVTQNHNLGVAPELIILKPRNGAGRNWFVIGSSGLTTGQYMFLENVYGATNYGGGGTSTWSATSTTITIPTGYFYTSSDYVTYLFATLAGVSKVGTYTGNGTTQTINCGFTGGARFVLIKRTDSTGDWYTYDTARGMTTLTDPYLLMNSTAAQAATLGSVTTVTTGFAVNATILAAINTSAATYIFLAIA